MNLNLAPKNLYPNSIKKEKNKVDIIEYVKKGIANKKHLCKPSSVNPYIPVDQTPKLVTMKKMTAPNKAPLILLRMFSVKNVDINPIKKTLPQVQWVPE